MFVTSKFKIEGDFFESARRALREAYDKNGYPPRKAMVHPETDIGNAKSISVMLGTGLHEIPLIVRTDLRFGFRLEDDEAVLDVCNPYSAFE